MRNFCAVLLLIATLDAYSVAQTRRPEWLGREPLVIVGNWDSMPIFRRRVGGQALDQEEEYRKQHTAEAVRKLKELGVTMGVIHFYKGFGLNAEAAHMADAKKLADLLHANGLRVGVYVGSTIGYETFLTEKPDAAEWFVPPYLGREVVYGNQTFRKRVYFMHPGYREYMKRVLRIALQDFHADLIHFDNTSLQAQAPIFLHPLAIQDFRRYLEEKYTPEQRTDRFGYPQTRYMEPPEWDRPLSAIDDPLFQEWADFRCRQLTAYYAEMEQYIRGLNPQTAVESNPHSGISGRNTVWEQGVDYPRLLGHMDVVWTEEGDEAQVTPGGVLVSKIRTYKMAETLHNRVFTYTGGERGSRLQMAEAMAFNRETLGQLGDGLAGYNFPEDQRRYVSFFHRNFDLFRDVHSRPDVAVLHSFASMAWNNDLPWQSAMLMEQVLIQAKIPFDIIFDAQLEDLSKYRALVLPDQECLTEEQMRTIREYVRNGGGLLATEQTSLYDAWRRRREQFGLRDVFGAGAAQYRENLYTPREYPSMVADSLRAGALPAAVRHNFGRGRCAYLPHVAPAVRKPAAASMTSQYWKLPLNSGEIIEAVKWAAQGVSLEVRGPATFVTEPLEQPATNRILLHLLNYDVAHSPSLDNIGVSFRLPAGKTVRNVRLFSPDATSESVIAYTVAAGALKFTIPHVRTYSIAVISF